MKVQFQFEGNAEEAPVTLEVKSRDGSFHVVLEGQDYLVEGGFTEPGILHMRIDGRPLRVGAALVNHQWHLAQGDGRYLLQTVDPDAARRATGSDVGAGNELASTMPGQVLKILVSEGDRVVRGQPVMIIEAMKMEHELKAPHAGTVKRLACVAGEMVSPGVPLAEIEPDPETT